MNGLFESSGLLHPWDEAGITIVTFSARVWVRV
jgi:hypothetical protein